MAERGPCGECDRLDGGYCFECCVRIWFRSQQSRLARWIYRCAESVDPAGDDQDQEAADVSPDYATSEPGLDKRDRVVDVYHHRSSHWQLIRRDERGDGSRFTFYYRKIGEGE